jgi:hypothetical protein
MLRRDFVKGALVFRLITVKMRALGMDNQNDQGLAPYIEVLK